MPVLVPLVYDKYVYSKEEIDDQIQYLIEIKADKVEGAVQDNIAGLTGTEGNLLDTGYSIADLLPGLFLNGGIFNDQGEVYE